MSNIISKLICDRRGVTVLEYGVIAFIVVVAITAGARPFGEAVRNLYESVTTVMVAAFR